MLALMVAPFLVYRSHAAGAAGLALLFFFTGSGHFLLSFITSSAAMERGASDDESLRRSGR